MVFLKNKETCSIVSGANDHGNSDDDSNEEIPSDFDDEEQTPQNSGDDEISSQSDNEEKEISTRTAKRLKRKRKRPDWVNLKPVCVWERFSPNRSLSLSLSFSLSLSLFLFLSLSLLCIIIQVTSAGRRDYEGYISKTHENFKPFRDSTIEKWSKRTKIASGKISSKVSV